MSLKIRFLQNYFRKYHGYAVKYGRIICVGFTKGIVYPLEVLEIKEGQTYRKALPHELSARAIKFATQKPASLPCLFRHRAEIFFSVQEDRLGAIKKGAQVSMYFPHQ